MQEGSHRCLFVVKTINSFEFIIGHFIKVKEQGIKTNIIPKYQAAGLFGLFLSV